MQGATYSQKFRGKCSFPNLASGRTFQFMFPKYLKLVSAFFYKIFIFSPNDSSLKIINNVFYFIEKALFVFKIFKFL